MLYLTNTIVSPSTYSLQSQINENTHFKFHLKDNDIYSFYQLADGTKHYIKNIGGVEYKYSTK